MMEALDGDVFAKSSAAPQRSLLATWVRYHQRWFGQESQPFPTWPMAVKAVAAHIKDSDYRSFANYVSRAKREHLAFGGEWSRLLVITAHESTRSVCRGIGPR